jgi:anti-sigma regulatory factor (Ser/Thr protein kinase)
MTNQQPAADPAETPLERSESFTYPAHPESVGQARSQLHKTLCDWGFGAIAGDMMSCLSEALTNALFYGAPDSGGVTFHVSASGHVVHIEVDDEDDTTEPQLQVPLAASHAEAPALAAVQDGGYGLFLVSTLSDKWGVLRKTAGKAVWFERDAAAAVPA